MTVQIILKLETTCRWMVSFRFLAALSSC